MSGLVSIDNLKDRFPHFINGGNIVPAYSSVIKSLFTRLQPHEHGANITQYREKLINIDDVDAATEGDIFAYEPEMDTSLRLLQSTKTAFTYNPKLYVAQFVVSERIGTQFLVDKTAQSISLLNKIFDKSGLNYICSLSNPLDEGHPNDTFPINNITDIMDLIGGLKSKIIDSTGGQDFRGNFRFLLTGEARRIVRYVSEEGTLAPLERQDIIQVPNSTIANDKYKDAILAIYQPEAVLHHSFFPRVLATQPSLMNAVIPDMRKTTVIVGMHSIGVELYNPNAMVYAKVEV